MQPTPDTVANVKTFLLAVWNERQHEFDRPKTHNLSGACKFAALFAKKLFGGTIEARPEHCWNKLPDGTTLDLTDQADAAKYDLTPEQLTTPDPEFMCDPDGKPNREFHDALKSCLPRVNQWLERFKQTTTPN
jgi:hypothetical protein